MNDLKPCPFCGSATADIWTRGTRRGRVAVAQCGLCSAQGKPVYYSDNDLEEDACERAADFWNMRKSEKEGNE